MKRIFLLPFAFIAALLMNSCQKEDDYVLYSTGSENISSEATIPVENPKEDANVTSPKDEFPKNTTDAPENTSATEASTAPPPETEYLTIPKNIYNYYKNIDLNENEENLKSQLSKLTREKHTRILKYKERHPFLEEADTDSMNPDNVILVYTGESRSKNSIMKGSGGNTQKGKSINTEHIYPQSYLKRSGDEIDAKIGDLHHLRYIDSSVNSSRSNHRFTEGSGENGKVTKTTWYPGDEWKGDVARMIMYMYIRYDLSCDKISATDVKLFLKWNAEDPVSPIERQRNDIIEKAQGNRNPFIDNPYFATKIFGEIEGYQVENTWK